MKKNLSIRAGQATLAQLREITFGDVCLQLCSEDLNNIEQSHNKVKHIVDHGKTVYGINTGFGLLANTSIASDQLSELQRNLLLSHSTGTGELLSDKVVKLILALKLLSLARGYSGVRPIIVESLKTLFNKQVYPCIPAKGSVGASGDLAPLSHLSIALLGEGQVRYQGKIISAKEGLEIAGLSPINLGPKEGLALINGTQVSTALALMELFQCETIYSAAIVAGCLSIEALKSTSVPFDARIHQLRGQPGQQTIAAVYLNLLGNSEIGNSHVGCEKIQDPYSLRCQPQVMGACLDLINNVSKTLLIEANAVTDNPLIFENGDSLSGGNFHAEPVAMAADTLAIAIAEIGSIAERRISLLVDPNMSQLPAFLVENSGLNSGFMIAQVTAAALASENKSLAHPASVDNIPTSANQEDHVSMATFAARRLQEMNTNTACIIGIELLAAAQGVDFHQPLKTSAELTKAMQAIREKVAFLNKDRYFAPDIEAAKQLVLSGFFHQWLTDTLPSLNELSLN